MKPADDNQTASRLQLPGSELADSKRGLPEVSLQGHCEPDCTGLVLGDQYKAICKLGRGRRSVVYLAEDITAEPQASRRFVAIKVLSLKATSASHPEGSYRELEIFQRLQAQPRVPYQFARLSDCFDQPSEDGLRLCLVMQPGLENVERWMSRSTTGSLGVEVSRCLLSNVVDCLTGFHDRGVIHSDVRSTNVLVGICANPDQIMEHMQLLGTFHPDVFEPISSQLDPHEQDRFTLEFCRFAVVDFSNALFTGQPGPAEGLGSFALRAPEVVLGARPWTAAVDVWAIGCLAYEILTGRPLLWPLTGDHSVQDDSKHLAMMLAVNQTDGFEGSWLATADDSKKDLLEPSTGQLRLVVTEQNHSLSIEDQLKAKGIPTSDVEGAASFILYCLTIGPTARPAMRDVMIHPWIRNVGHE